MARIIVVNTDRGILEKLKSLLGGNIYVNRRSPNKRWKPLLSWKLQHRDALNLTEAVYEHLTVKKKAAWAFLAWRSIQEEYKTTERRPYYKLISDWLHTVNQRGAKV